MATEDKRRQFEQIVEGLTADYPALARRGRPWPRALLVTFAVVGGFVWAALSVAMVAWGAAGVILTCSVVAAVAIALAVDSYRRHH
jgi:hypothetical protein